MSHKERIQQLLIDKPGLKAQQIAEELGLEKAHVATALHGFSSTEMVQDSNYRWWPRKRETPGEAGAEAHPLLSRLCRYYLDCLSRESGAGVSLPASAQEVEYLPLDTLPFAGVPQIGNTRAMRRLTQKVQRERGQLALFIGYGLRVRNVVLRNQEELRVEPVLLYPIAESGEDRLQPSSGIPIFNPEVLKSLAGADSGNVIDEAILLSEELGLANADEDLPAWDEIILRLQHRRPDWDWSEPLNPYQLGKEPHIAELSPTGIYNRAILFAGTRSPFTYGLEIELRKLAQLTEDEVRDTALGVWLRGATIATPMPDDRPILETLPLNTEQRQAVVQGLNAALTVVTGPPGTGKSQVVTSLLVNQAWHGSSVLFSSRNNHAVEVVESRVNSLGPSPLLLRLGRDEHQTLLAQHLTATLAESASLDDSTGYERLRKEYDAARARYAAVQRQFAAVVELRNRVDQLEREAEPARAIFGQAAFAKFRDLDAEGIAHRIGALSEALEAAHEDGQPAMVRMVWDAVRSRRYQRASETAAALTTDAETLRVALPQSEPASWERFRAMLADRLPWAARAQNYLRAFDELRAAPALERLAQELTRIADESAQNSLELWQNWLRLRPGRWSPEQRRLLGEYVSLLQMIAGGDRFDEGAGRKVFRRYYSLFPKVTRVLPCWAVTSLSARGRLPFEAGLFDLVVIDEASQCDIASALPLLFRARRAVVIGDPLQLKHVSAVVPQQDRLMMAAHGLAADGGIWAYSVNSLFDLSRSLCRHDDLVNLRDHHRSHRDIIAFSNRHFYRGRLRVVTDHDALKRPESSTPGVRWVNVRGKVVRPPGGGAVNSPEADLVLKQVRKLVMEVGFSGSIGVVTPFRAQANRIRTLAHQDRELTEKLASMQFVVDTVHGFQGDERDIIFFSPVVSVGIGESAIRFLKGNGNLFNVAITRARSELIVVGDHDAALKSDVGYLAGFAEYTQGLAAPGERPTGNADAGPEYPPVAHPELVSEWERIFYRAMYSAGLRPIPQYDEAPYTLDFALFDGTRRLDLEIDGEYYHRHWDGELCRRDQIRSRRLSDAGWDILRLWVYEVRDDPAGSLERVVAWEAMGPSLAQQA
jgi:very-short-patch-repair endonuclease